MSKILYFVCKLCRWTWQGTEKSNCPHCGSAKVQVKKRPPD